MAVYTSPLLSILLSTFIVTVYGQFGGFGGGEMGQIAQMAGLPGLMGGGGAQEGSLEGLTLSNIMALSGNNAAGMGGMMGGGMGSMNAASILSSPLAKYIPLKYQMMILKGSQMMPGASV